MDHEVWYHGLGPRAREHVQQHGLTAPPGVNPAGWPMLTSSREQAAQYAGTNGSVLEYHIPKHLTHYRNPGAVLWPAQPHGAYGHDAQAAGIKGTLGNEHLVAEHPVGVRRTAAHPHQDALDRLSQLPGELIQGRHLHRLLSENKIHLHEEDPWEAGEVDDDHMTGDTGKSIHHAPHVELHTAQNNLKRSTLEHFIRNPGESGSAERPSTWTHEGQHWINTGHHRIVADRMAQRQGTTCSDRTKTAVKKTADGPEKDAHRLRFTEPNEVDSGGSKWPNEGYIRAHHPDHGEVGHVRYMRGNRVNSPIMIKMLQVHPDHQRKGYGSALMDNLQTTFPKAKINHGDRTNAGSKWWKSYGQGSDRRGRTGRARGQPCEGCAGTGELPSGSECGACDGSGYNPTCPCGLGVMRDGDEWVHRDGSVSHDGRWYPHSVAELMRRYATPTKRLFGPTHGLDHRLFDGEALKADVTHYILSTLDGFLRPLYGAGWQRWMRVYLAGSEASEWTSPELEGNNDFDVLVGVNYDRAREDVIFWADSADQEITDELNREFRTGLIPRTDPVTITIDGEVTGPWSNTWYCNPNSWDIRDIKPYAAYDVTNHEWAVHPPHLPEWDIEQFPEGHALVEMGEAYERLIKAIFDLPEPYRTQQGNALWTYLHTDRSRAFGPEGEGWYDPGNVMEKWLDQDGLWADLWAIHHRADEDPTTLLAPAGWSNDPRG